MLKRKIEAQIELWRENHSGTALLVSGARQVGKTFILHHFIETHYESAIELDLIADRQLADALNSANTAADIMTLITAAANVNLKPQHSVIFIDEVQAAPNLVTQIKYLVQEYPYDFIFSGSTLEDATSLPVGFVHNLRLYPCDFEEFCWAAGVSSDALDLVKDTIAEGKPVVEYLHTKLMQLFATYLVVGGMPAATSEYFATTNVQQVQTIQRDIVTLYKADISKYAPTDRRLVIRNIYDLIPSELAKENKRFRFSSIEQVKRFAAVADEFFWLTSAGVAISVPQVTAPIAPLVLMEDRAKFKFFSSDVGLLTSMFPQNTAVDILSGAPTANLGGMYENFVAQELVAHGFSPRYFSNRKVGELDFLVEKPDGDLLALEVKSGAGYRTHRALDKALSTEGYGIDDAYVVGRSNMESDGRVTYVPIYATGMLPEVYE